MFSRQDINKLVPKKNLSISCIAGQNLEAEGSLANKQAKLMISLTCLCRGKSVMVPLFYLYRKPARKFRFAKEILHTEPKTNTIFLQTASINRVKFISISLKDSIPCPSNFWFAWKQTYTTRRTRERKN
jgi:hypothetical protein